MSLYTFKPIYQERIWGGRNLETLYKRTLPGTGKIGESWELSDRPEACSELTEPDGDNKTLHDLWVNKRKEVFGTDAPDTPRFPMLLKLLDCVEKLSVQVHPPAAVAAQLKGEPKTELWYFLHTEKDANIYVGLKKGVTRADFEKAIGTPKLADLLQSLKTEPSQVMFLPSGRIHAIGAGNVIFEIQQNSDTTYRVDDWNRVDDKGKARALHIQESLASINFNDVEPTFGQPHGERVIECPYFSIYRTFIFPGEYRTWNSDGSSFQYHFVAQGDVKQGEREFHTGDGWLVSADAPRYDLQPGKEGVELVTIQLGND
jgi:mannose-6-phosphate isomerase